MAFCQILRGAASDYRTLISFGLFLEKLLQKFATFWVFSILSVFITNFYNQILLCKEFIIFYDYPIGANVCSINIDSQHSPFSLINDTEFTITGTMVDTEYFDTQWGCRSNYDFTSKNSAINDFVPSSHLMKKMWL